MDISRHLAVLIKEKKRVIVPGLGTFYKVQLPAKYDSASESFLPPTERIDFKPEFVADQTLLNFISRFEDTDPASVNPFLQEFVNNLNDLLNSTELIKIDALGTFEKSGNSFLFEADDTLKNNPAYFGLKPQKETKITASASNLKAVDEEEEEEIDFEEGIEYQNSGKKKALFVLILVLIAFAAIQIFYPNFWSATNKPEPAITKAPEPIIKIDSVQAIDSSAVKDSSNVLKTDTIAAPAIQTPTTTTYEIVVAAFGKRSEADAFIKQLAGKGITARALPNRTKEYIKISTGSFTDQKLAEAELKRIQTELSKGAWMYKIKPLKTN